MTAKQRCSLFPYCLPYPRWRRRRQHCGQLCHTVSLILVIFLLVAPSEVVSQAEFRAPLTVSVEEPFLCVSLDAGLRARNRVNKLFLRLIVQQRLTACISKREHQPRHRRRSLMDDKRLAPLVADWEPIVADNRLALAVFKIPVNSGLHLFRRRIFGRSPRFRHAVTAFSTLARLSDFFTPLSSA